MTGKKYLAVNNGEEEAITVFVEPILLAGLTAGNVDEKLRSIGLDAVVANADAMNRRTWNRIVSAVKMRQTPEGTPSYEVGCISQRGYVVSFRWSGVQYTWEQFCQASLNPEEKRNPRLWADQ